MPGSNELIKEVLESVSKRDSIAYGMSQRSKLEAAGRFTWIDPREADGVPILARRKISDADLNQRIHVPFDRMISTNKAGYFAADITITYGDGVPDQVKAFYKSLYERARWRGMTLSLADASVTQGAAYILCSIEDGEFWVSQSPSISTKVVYDKRTHKPLYGLRYGRDIVELYDGMEMTVYHLKDGIWTPGETVLHGMGTASRPMVPIIEFRNSPDRIGNPERVITLCDAYDVSMSDLSNELAALRLSYLLLKGLGERADVVKKQLKNAGVIIIDSDNGDARFITKNLNPEAVRLLQDNLRSLIFEGASSYDPTSFAEGSSPTAYEVSQRLAALEMDTNITVGQWDEGFRQLDYIIQTYLTTFTGVSDYPIWEIDRIYRRTAPKNDISALVEARNAGLNLSNETKIELSGLQIDPDEEALRIQNDPNIIDAAPVTGLNQE